MAKMVIKSVAEMDRKRKNLRKTLFFASLPFLLIILFFAVKTTIMYVTTQNVISLTEEKKFEEAAKVAENNRENSFVDPWVAEYNVGTTKYNVGEYSAAINALENALTYEPPYPEICSIYNALSKSYEKAGDEATERGDKTKSEEFYMLAKSTISEAPANCFPPPPPDSQQSDDETDEQEPEDKSDEAQEGASDVEAQKQGTEMRETERRVDDKLNQGQPSEGEEKPETDLDEQGKEDQIQDQLNEGDKSRQDDEAANGEGKGQEPADKPW